MSGRPTRRELENENQALRKQICELSTMLDEARQVMLDFANNKDNYSNESIHRALSNITYQQRIQELGDIIAIQKYELTRLRARQGIDLTQLVNLETFSPLSSNPDRLDKTPIDPNIISWQLTTESGIVFGFQTGDGTLWTNSHIREAFLLYERYLTYHMVGFSSAFPAAEGERRKAVLREFGGKFREYSTKLQNFCAELGSPLPPDADLCQLAEKFENAISQALVPNVKNYDTVLDLCAEVNKTDLIHIASIKTRGRILQESEGIGWLWAQVELIKQQKPHLTTHRERFRECLKALDHLDNSQLWVTNLREEINEALSGNDTEFEKLKSRYRSANSVRNG